MYEIIVALTVISERLAELVMNAFFSDNSKSERALIAYGVTTFICAVFAVPLQLNIFSLFDTQEGFIASLLTAAIMGLGTQWVHYVINTFCAAVEGG